jgi:hypothetical protein
MEAQKKWDLLGYDNYRKRTMEMGVDLDRVKALREEKNLRAYHLFPASEGTTHLTRRRRNLGYEQWNARDFFFSYVLSIDDDRIPTKEEVIS